MASLGTVLPGTDVSRLVEGALGAGSVAPGDARPVARLGAGLVQLGAQIVAVRSGVLQHSAPRAAGARFWVAGRARRYVPVQGHHVLGVVVGRTAEAYRVDVGAAQVATLSQVTGFEGATKKSRPTFEVGDLVFARVAVASKDLEPELACFDAATGEAAGFGAAASPDAPAMVYGVSLEAARALQHAGSVLLDVLGRRFAYEAVVGANGRVAVAAKEPADVFRVGAVISALAEHADVAEADVLAEIDRVVRGK